VKNLKKAANLSADGTLMSFKKRRRRKRRKKGLKERSTPKGKEKKKKKIDEEVQRHFSKYQGRNEGMEVTTSLWIRAAWNENGSGPGRRADFSAYRP